MSMTDPFPVLNPKPCPFCGDNLVTVHQGETYRWRVAICDSCGAQAPDVRHSILEGQTRDQAFADANKRAIEAWNERAKGIEESIRADEREACARICDAEQKKNEDKGQWMWEAKKCGIAIRARRNK